MTHFKPLVIAATALVLACQAVPALADYCGPSADANAIEGQIVAAGTYDRSRIMDIDVVGNYARVDIQTKGRLTQYYAKDCGRWRYVGTSVPADAPAGAQSELSSFVPSDDGGTKCKNPHFVSHPSAP
jgi:hypothetical protein